MRSVLRSMMPSLLYLRAANRWPLLYRIDETGAPAIAGTHLSGARNSEPLVPAFAGTPVTRDGDVFFLITQALSDSDIETARRLFRAYAESLPFSLAFQGFEAELAGLPAPYLPPGGCLLLARRDGEVAGVIGLKPLAPGTAEIKRLFVVPEARGLGLGKRLAERAIAEARAKGYERVRLDTHRPSMPGAIALYRSLGFAEIPPYGPDLDGQIAFFEKRLPG
jgi:ribosomal protein S18 acetylase RimI-like enzyme